MRLDGGPEFPCPHCGEPIRLEPRDFFLRAFFVCTTCARRSGFPLSVWLLSAWLSLVVMAAGAIALKRLGVFDPETPFDFAVAAVSFLALALAGAWVAKVILRRATTHLAAK